MQQAQPQVMQALQTALSPGAPEQLKSQALQFLEQFKRDEGNAEWAFAVLKQPGSPAEARLFALQCLEALLKVKWKGWTAEGHRLFRSEVMALMEVGVGSEVFMRERIALLVSGVGEREYPQHWPSMLDDFRLVMETRGPMAAVIVLMALRDMAEDCMDADFNSRLPTGRRTDILRQLNLELPALLPRLYRFMETTYQTRNTNPAAAEVLKAALQTLKRLVGWIPHDLLFGPEMSFVDVFRFLVREDPTRLEAMECLRDLGSRRFDNMAYLKQYMEKLELGLTELLSNGPAWSSLVFAETACAALSGFLSQNLERMLVEDKAFTAPGSPENALLLRYLQLMVQMLKLPSMKAGAALLGGWMAVYKAQGLKGVPDTAEALLVVVLESFCDRGVKLHYDEGAGCFADSPVADEEFVDVDEYHAMLSVLKANVVTLIKFAAELYPHRSLDFLQERLPRLVRLHGGATDVTVASDSYRYFEALASPVDKLLTSLPEPQDGKDEDVQMMQKISWLLQVVLDWHVTDPLLLYCHCLLLEGFRRFYRFLKPQLLAVLERLFKYMEYRDPSLVGRSFARPSLLMKSLSQEALQVRRRGSNSLTEICNNVPDIVVSLLPQMVQLVDGLVMKGEVSDAQRPQLVEMLVVVSNAMDNPAARTSFITDLVKTALAYWEGGEVSANLSSVSGLLKMLGVGADGSVPGSEDAWDLVYDDVHALLGALNTFLGVTRRLRVPTQEDISSKDPDMARVGKALITDRLSLDDLSRINPFVPIWSRVLPNLTAFMRSLHGLWGPETRPVLLAHAEARHILSMHDDELQSRVKGTTSRSTALADLPPLRRWPLWLNQLRQSVYQLLERACYHKVIYYSQDTLVAMQEAVVSALPWMEHRHVPWFIKMVVETYVVHCPTPLFATHLPPILAPFMNHMLLRCSVTWSNGQQPMADPAARYLLEGGILVTTDGLTSDNYETMQDKLKREVTRAYVEGLQTFLALRGSMVNTLTQGNKVMQLQQQTLGAGKRAESPCEPRPTPPACAVRQYIDALSRFLVADCEAVAVPLLLSLMGALCWQDQHTCRRAVSVTQRVLEVGGKEPKLYAALGRELFGELVNALVLEPPWVMGIQNDLVALASEIYRLQVIGEDARVDPATGQRTPQLLCELPRQYLLTVPGLSAQVVAEMEAKMLGSHTCKEQREAFKEAMQIAVEALGENGVAQLNGNPQAAPRDESILRKKAFHEVSDLPGRIIERGSSLAEGRRAGVAVDLQASVAALFGTA